MAPKGRVALQYLQETLLGRARNLGCFPTLSWPATGLVGRSNSDPARRDRQGPERECPPSTLLERRCRSNQGRSVAIHVLPIRGYRHTASTPRRSHSRQRPLRGTWV